MKKPVTEERKFCDFCEEPGYTECIVCGKDLCSKHRLELIIYMDYESQAFRVSLCREDAQPLRPFLESLAGKSTNWEKAGQNPEYNERKLAEVLLFLGAFVRAKNGAAKV